MSVQELSADKTAKYLAALSLYALCVGCVYLWGYWTPFNVNILEYVALADIAKAAALPVITLAASTAVGIIASDFLLGTALPPGGGRDTPTGIWLNRKLRWIVPLYGISIAVLWSSGLTAKWDVLGWLIGMPCAVAAQRLGFLVNVVADNRVRMCLTMLLFLTPPLAFSSARHQAVLVLSGVAFDYVLLPADGAVLPTSEIAKTRTRYLGHAGEVVFFWEPDRSSLTVTKLDSTHPLSIAHYGRGGFDVEASLTKPETVAPKSLTKPVAGAAPAASRAASFTAGASVKTLPRPPSPPVSNPQRG